MKALNKEEMKLLEEHEYVVTDDGVRADIDDRELKRRTFSVMFTGEEHYERFMLRNDKSNPMILKDAIQRHEEMTRAINLMIELDKVKDK